jgi:hypothetical protein
MFKQQVQLVGVIKKTGSGTLESGQAWSHDHVELHVLVKLDEEKGGFGSSTVTHRVQGAEINFAKAKPLVSKTIEISFEMSTNGKSQAVVLKPISFEATQTKQAA